MAEIELRAAELRFVKKAEREDGCGGCGGCSGNACVFVGDVENGLVEEIDGRWDTQSWTRSETRGLDVRLSVFFVPGWVVMTITGPDIEVLEEMLFGGRG